MYASDFKHKTEVTRKDTLHFDALNVHTMQEMDSQLSKVLHEGVGVVGGRDWNLGLRRLPAS